MEEYELDTYADQILRWLRDELAAGGQFGVLATREFTTESADVRAEAGLSDHTDATSMTTIGLLEAWPSGTDEGWRLQVRVEDVVGPHTPEEESAPDGPEEIDLDDFEAQFISPDRGTVHVSVRVDSPEAKRRFDRTFAKLIRNRHTG